MKKRIICLLLALALMLGICGMLASCGGGPTGEGGGERDEGDFEGDDKNVSKYYDYTWGTTSLRVEMSDHSSKDLLVSRVKRYLSGEDAGDDRIDELISFRNGQAENVTRTDIQYKYLQDIPTYGWGSNISRIARESQSYSETSADIYVNFIFDLVAASLQGAFANLKSVQMPGSVGVNYFEFMSPGENNEYNAAVDDEGYMYDLMHSLSFSTKKMYVLASDYFTDVMRSFFSVPVNIAMINGIDPYMVGEYNYIDDGKFDIDDFFKIVWNYNWNYEAVKALSLAVYDPAGATPDPTVDVNGFLLGDPDHAVGMLYGTDVEIITRTLNPITGLYEVEYPEYCESYTNVALALSDLFSSTGIGLMPATGSTATTISSYHIRQSFISDRCLFGSVVMAGNLEHTDYQMMNAEGEGGFGVAPVPMYRAFDEAKDVDKNGKNIYYRTAPHNIAKVAAISVATSKYKQCVAWLDYQSTHSSEILNTYYEDILMYQIAGNNENNILVLDMLRDNATTALDKIYDDAIYRVETSPNKNVDARWCRLLRDAKYKLDDVRVKYSNAVSIKEDALEEIYKKYNSDLLRP